jgi:hypothetical protein
VLTETIVDNQFKYRFMLYDAHARHTIEGNFLFDEPREARDTEIALIATHPTYEIWLEDRYGCRVKIPR